MSAGVLALVLLGAALALGLAYALGYWAGGAKAASRQAGAALKTAGDIAREQEDLARRAQARADTETAERRRIADRAASQIANPLPTTRDLTESEARSAEIARHLQEAIDRSHEVTADLTPEGVAKRAEAARKGGGS